MITFSQTRKKMTAHLSEPSTTAMFFAEVSWRVLIISHYPKLRLQIFMSNVASAATEQLEMKPVFSFVTVEFSLQHYQKEKNCKLIAGKYDASGFLGYSPSC